MLKFNHKNFTIFLILLIIEVIIALYIKQHFIRHVFGDYLCVIMLFYFFRSFLQLKPIYTALIVLIISFFIEILQLINIINILNIQNNIIKIIIGTSFSVIDLVAYSLGILTVLIFEKLNSSQFSH